MIPISLLNQKVTIMRRSSQGVDALNNPIYGSPTDGSGWFTVYKDMPVRMAFSSKQVRFAPEGERILPTGTVYYNANYNLKAEDRVLTTNSIEYNVISVIPAYLTNKVISHFEAVVQLP